MSEAIAYKILFTQSTKIIVLDEFYSRYCCVDGSFRHKHTCKDVPNCGTIFTGVFFWPARLSTDTRPRAWLKGTFELGGTLRCLIFETIRGII